MVTNSTTPLTSISVIRKGQKNSATHLVHFSHQQKEIMSNNNSNKNTNVCSYPRRWINATNCGENEQRNVPTAAAEAGNAADDTPTIAAMLDFDRIGQCVNRLEASGWYYGRLNWQEATNLLKSTPVGTFLVRDSSDPAYLFALTVQTEYGPTSIRIHYINGQFKLDAEETLACRMPLFDCAVRLIDYYVRLSSTDKRSSHVWLDETGRRDRAIFLDRPLYHSVTQLQHLCRLTVNQHYTLPINRIHLPKTVTNYLADYPYVR